MWPVASFPQSFPKIFFGKHQYSFQTGSRSCQVSNGIKGSNATDYAGLRLDCTGVPDIPFPFFTQTAEEPFFQKTGSKRRRDKDFCYELRELGNRPFDFSNRCPLQAPFVLFVDFQHVTLIKDYKMNV